MNLDQLAKKYGRHADRIIQRIMKTNIMKANTATQEQKLGILYYCQAAQDVRHLDDYSEHSNKGFEMRSAAQFGPEKMSLVKPEEKII